MEKTVEAAREGDHDCIHEILNAYQSDVSEGRTPPPQILQFVAESLDKVNDATKGLVPLLAGDRGKPKAYNDEWVAEMVLCLVDAGKTQAEAFGEIANLEIGYEEDQIRNIFRKHKRRWDRLRRAEEG